MNLKPDNLPPTDTLGETIDFFGPGGGGHRREPDHPGASPAPEGRHRYTFGSGARPLEGYTIKRAIGRGGFGEVYYAISDSGKEVALKLITRNLEIERRGVAQCMNLKCPNLLAIHDIKSNDDGDTFVIMEYVAGPNLAQVLADYPDGMPLPDVRAWFRGLVEGVGYLHDHGIVHRDLKPANLFMEEGVVKIGDYGLSKMITSERVSNHSESIGTCHYMAPEISTGKYNKPIDIYAMGVILFEMIVGSVPFDGETVGEVLIKHLTTRPDLARLPEPYRGIVAQALAKDPAHRSARAVDLLLPSDAPVTAAVRFIGDGKAAAPAAIPRGGARPGPAPVPTPAPLASAWPTMPAPSADEILRINDEEPILYIGPDTQPPRRPSRGQERRERRQERRLARGQRAVTQVARRVRLIADGPIMPEEPILPPPPLPVGRVRVGQLAGAMFAASYWSALGSLVVGALLQLDVTNRPQDVGFLFAMTTLASWTTLIGTKFTEGKKVSTQVRRGGQLATGAALGVAALALANWLLVEPVGTGNSITQLRWFDADVVPAALPEVLGYATFFGLVGLGVDWWRLTDRDRRSRFRLFPIAKAALIGLIPTLLFFASESHPLALPVVILTSAVVQASASWNEAAARYTRATRYHRQSIA